MKRAEIARLNDAFRRALIGSSVPGRTVMTRGVAALDPDTLARVLGGVRTFARFTPDNDPHGEHDLGIFEVGGLRVLWKIDYYADEQMEFGAEDATQAYRVLTIMLASEY